MLCMVKKEYKESQKTNDQQEKYFFNLYNRQRAYIKTSHQSIEKRKIYRRQFKINLINI